MHPSVLVTASSAMTTNAASFLISTAKGEIISSLQSTVDGEAAKSNMILEAAWVEMRVYHS